MRLDIRRILADSQQRRRLFIGVIIATQAREGIEVTPEQALAAYEKARREKERGL